MKTEIIIRPIKISDAEKVLEIYRPYIENTNITFEYTVPNLEEWRERIETVSKQFPWLVAELEGDILGYAYAAKHRDRIAYQWCCEASVYLSDNAQGKGFAKILYEKLFEILKIQGYINVYAILTSPNTKSEKFHENFRFNDVGRFYKAGFKFNEWHHTRWMQLHLNEHEIPPSELIPFSEIEQSDEVQIILRNN
ncbi:GNAT family N-acetyltransferase [Moheibacter sediminis]|uniref:Phosphinothricin acetyltransferase n=1 Tax=Moheibacter sediminis TaxID=1434700 RepID=A0A1W2BVI7_9FLAO|nr:GNAT family N-acetyltransferase [Moheibacter sediminis]SMC76967.1 phosphinothricin acetyltransferase [Moheibacter sediminis]